MRGIGLNIFFSLFLLFPFLSARFFPLERKEDGEEEEEEEGEFRFGEEYNFSLILRRKVGEYMYIRGGMRLV